jgi:predicted nuclease of predicted toxin-antitoxin system
MKLLLDQGLPRSSADLLRRQGVDAVHLGEIGMFAAEDADILERGRAEGRAVVTLDADFHSILATSNALTPSVIRIRIEGLKAGPLAELLRQVLTACSTEVEAGAAVTVQPGRIRIRRLPLLGD